MSTWLIDTALYTAILIALILVLRRPVGRAFGPGIAYALWALPLLRLLMPPLVLPAGMAPAPQPVALDASTLALLLAAEETNSAAPSLAWQWTDPALPLWLGSAALFLAWRMWNYRRMRRDLLAGARPVGEAGKVRLVESPAVASPVAFGVLDKVVALPPHFMAMEDRRARDLAIAHELAHHAGHDILANFAAQPLLALHWFNPLAWLGWRAMRRDQEAACDARVLAGRDPAERAAYADLLAGFATGPRLALAASMACPILGEKSIVHRLRSLSMTNIPRSRRTAGRLLLGAAAVALPLTASVSYARGEALEGAELPPSTAAPAGEAAPEADEQVRVFPFVGEKETVAAAPDGEPRARHFELRRESDAAQADSKNDVLVFRDGHPLSEEQLKELREIGARFEGRDWDEFARRHEMLAERMAEMQARMPLVERRCDDEDTPVRNHTDADGRKRIEICERTIERQALRGATLGLRHARSSIAASREIDAEVRSEILHDLDREIERLERENRES